MCLPSTGDVAWEYMIDVKCLIRWGCELELVDDGWGVMEEEEQGDDEDDDRE